MTKNTVLKCLVILFVAVVISFSLLYFFHRVGEGDSYTRSSSGGGRMAFGPAVSPANGLIALSSFQTGHGDIYIVDEDGHHLNRLTDDSYCEMDPVFSPDGKQIAYIKETWQAFSINVFKGQAWIMNADGSHQRPITHDQNDYAGPVFSADGKSLFLTRITPDFAVQRVELYRTDVSGTETPVPASEGELPSVLPTVTGKYYYSVDYDAKTNTTSIWVQQIGREGNLSNKVRLQEGWSLTASPDNRRLAFISQPFSQTLWVTNTEGNSAQNIRKSANYLSQPVFGKDGKSIFFHESSMSGPVAVSKVRLDGSDYVQVARTSK